MISETHQRIMQIIGSGEPLFRIGDSVTSKRLGPIMNGFVVSIEVGIIHAIRCQIDIGRTRWTEHYPGWENGFVYYVEVSEPMRPLSEAEFNEAKERGVYHTEMPYSMIPAAHCLPYVEEDLEKMA